MSLLPSPPLRLSIVEAGRDKLRIKVGMGRLSSPTAVFATKEKTDQYLEQVEVLLLKCLVR